MDHKRSSPVSPRCNFMKLKWTRSNELTAIGLALCCCLSLASAASQRAGLDAVKSAAPVAPASSAGAPFYSIKDGKLSTQRIQSSVSSSKTSSTFLMKPKQQQSDSAPLNKQPKNVISNTATANNADDNTDRSTANTITNIINNNNNNQEAATTTPANLQDLLNGTTTTSQPSTTTTQLFRGELEQDKMMDKIIESTSSALMSGGDSLSSDRSGDSTPSNVATSTRLSTNNSKPNSISMSLDGMVLSARPRSSNHQLQQQTTVAISTPSKPTARLGDMNIGGGAVKSRRDHMMAPNSFGWPSRGPAISSSESPSIPTTSTSSAANGNAQDLIEAISEPANQPMNINNNNVASSSSSESEKPQSVQNSNGNLINFQLMPQDKVAKVESNVDAIDNVNVMMNRVGPMQSSFAKAMTMFGQQIPLEQTQMIMNLNQNNQISQQQQSELFFDQQPRVESVSLSDISLASNGESNNNINQQQEQQQQFLQDLMMQNNNNNINFNANQLQSNLMNNGESLNFNGNNNNNNDMIMSLMTSPDGKERRLVMIGRDTLDSLQKIAKATTMKHQQHQNNNDNSNSFQPINNPTKTFARQQQQESNIKPAKSQSGSATKTTPIQNGPSSSWRTNNNNNNNRPTSTTQTSAVTVNSSASSFQRPINNDVTTPSIVSTTTPTTTVTPILATTINTNSNVNRNSIAQTTTTTTTTATSQQPTSTTSSIMQDMNQSQQPVSTSASNNKQANQATKTGKNKKSGPAKSSGSSSSSGNQNNTSRNQNSGNQAQSAKNTNKNGTKNKSKVSSGNATGLDNLTNSNSTRANQANKPKQNNKSKTTSNNKNKTTKKPIIIINQDQSNQGETNEQRNGNNNWAAMQNGQFDGVNTNGQQQMKPMNRQQQAPSDLQGPTTQNLVTITTSTLPPTTSAASSTPGRPNSDTNFVSTTPSSPTTSSAGDFPMRSRSFDQHLDDLERGSQGPTTTTSSQKPSDLQQTRNNGHSSPASLNNNNNNDLDMNDATTGGDSQSDLRSSVPGEPGLDYPVYAMAPKTSFSCSEQTCSAGYYADVESQCQAFHVCQFDGRFDTFLCPNGTIFSQQHFVCVWWWQVECSLSSQSFKLNDAIYCNAQLQQQPNGISNNNDFMSTFDMNNNSIGEPSTSTPATTSDADKDRLISNDKQRQQDDSPANSMLSSNGEQEQRGSSDGQSTGSIWSSMQQQRERRAGSNSGGPIASVDSNLPQQSRLELRSRGA